MKHLTFLKYPAVLAASIALLVSCNGCNSGGTSTTTTPTTKDSTATPSTVKVPDFNVDSAYAYMDKQVAFGPRTPNSKEHEECSKWLQEEFGQYADKITLQQGKITAFDNKALSFTNIIASFNPQAKNRILLSAHWDTRPWADQDDNPANHNTPILGADDAASGVAVLLEIARQLKANHINLGVDLVLFDIEDYGQPDNSKYPRQEDTYGLGSQYWAKNLHVAGYQAKYGILLDMVSGKGSQFRMEGNSMQYAPDLVQRVWGLANNLGYGQYFPMIQAPPIDDDHYYMNLYSGVPTIDIIDLDPSRPKLFNPVWHTLNDNMDNVDKGALKAVGQTLLQLLYNEDKAAS